MNACLRDLAKLVIDAFRDALDACGVKGRFFLTQNDGTLMDAAYAERFPVLTFASGPTNSIRGAAFLSGVAEAIVVDIGGTTIGRRRAAQGLSAAGDRRGRGRRRPDQLPHARRLLVRAGRRLAGGRRPGGVKVGPTSVGYRLTKEALVFGGETLTTTDIVVAAGRAHLGDHKKVAQSRQGSDRAHARRKSPTCSRPRSSARASRRSRCR